MEVRIQPFPLPTDRCKCQNFHDLVIKILPSDQWRFTLLLPHYLSDKTPYHSYLFSQLAELPGKEIFRTQ